MQLGGHRQIEVQEEADCLMQEEVACWAAPQRAAQVREAGWLLHSTTTCQALWTACICERKEGIRHHR